MDFLAQAHAFLFHVFRLTVWLVVLVAIFVPLEHWLALRPTERLWRKQAGVDMAWYFINGLLPAALIALPLSVLAQVLHGADPEGLYSTVARWPLWLKVLATLFVSDVGSYWVHRAMHTWPGLWRIHAIHHSAEHVDWLVNTRAHPFDIVLMRLGGLVPAYLLGFAQATPGGLDPVVAIVTIFGIVWTFFIHANVNVRLGPVEWLISTPAFHHWHHTNDEHRDRNFAAIFPIIDKAFGTAWLPNHFPPVYGVDAQVAPTLTGQLLDPLSAA